MWEWHTTKVDPRVYVLNGPLCDTIRKSHVAMYCMVLHTTFRESIYGFVCCDRVSDDLMLQIHKVCKRIIHEDFKGSPHDGGDIALLELSKEVKNYRPISKMTYAGSGFIRADCDDNHLATIGWFASRPDGPPAPQLEILPGLSKTEDRECASVFNKWPTKVLCVASQVTTNMACEWFAVTKCGSLKTKIFLNLLIPLVVLGPVGWRACGDPWPSG